jgi:hypothetical protein
MPSTSRARRAPRTKPRLNGPKLQMSYKGKKRETQDPSLMGAKLLFSWCPEPDSNRHNSFESRDFKSLVSTYSTIRAVDRMNSLQRRNFQCFYRAQRSTATRVCVTRKIFARSGIGRTRLWEYQERVTCSTFHPHARAPAPPLPGFPVPFGNSCRRDAWGSARPRALSFVGNSDDPSNAAISREQRAMPG